MIEIQINKMPLLPNLLSEVIDNIRQVMESNGTDSPSEAHDTGSNCRRGKSSSCKCRDIEPYVNDKDQFKVHLDVQQFKPKELRVTVDDGFLIVDAKHEERSDEHGFISRQFQRKYKIPEDVDPNTISSQLSCDGVLCLHAQKIIKQGEIRELPITVSDTPLRILVEQDPGQ